MDEMDPASNDNKRKRTLPSNRTVANNMLQGSLSSSVMLPPPKVRVAHDSRLPSQLSSHGMGPPPSPFLQAFQPALDQSILTRQLGDIHARAAQEPPSDLCRPSTPPLEFSQSSNKGRVLPPYEEWTLDLYISRQLSSRERFWNNASDGIAKRMTAWISSLDADHPARRQADSNGWLVRHVA